MTSSPATSEHSEHSLARDSVRTTLTNVILFFLGILIWIATARFLPTPIRGVLALIMIAPSLVLRIGLLGMDQGIVVMAGADKSLLSPLTRTARWFGLLLGILFMGAMWALMFGFPQTFHQVTQLWPSEPFMLITLAFPLHLMTLAFDAAVYAEDRIAARNTKELVVNCMMLGVMSVAFFAFHLELFAVIGAYIIANLMSLVYAALLLVRRVRLSGDVRPDLGRKAIRIGFPICLAQIASFIMLPTMMVVLSFAMGDSHTRNLARIAFFAMAYQMVDRILPITRSIAFALLPKITAGSDDVAGELAAKASRHTVLASVILFVLLVLFAEPVVPILLGRRYLPLVGAFKIMAPGGIALSMAGVWAAHLLARGRSLTVAWAGLAGVAAALVLSWFGFTYVREGRELLVASVSVAAGGFVNAGVLLPAFCRAAGIGVLQALIPRIEDVRDWQRIPGFIAEILKRRHPAEEKMDYHT